MTEPGEGLPQQDQEADRRNADRTTGFLFKTFTVIPIVLGVENIVNGNIVRAVGEGLVAMAAYKYGSFLCEHADDTIK